MTFHEYLPFDQDPRRLQPLKDAVAAVKEEQELEGIVRVVGGERAQDAAAHGNLGELVRELLSA